MVAYKVLKPTPPPTPGSLQTLSGGHFAKASTIGTALANQDKTLWTGARVHAQTGCYGAQSLRIPDTDPSSTASQDYPSWDHEVIVSRSLVTLTPGYVLQAHAICLPSGATQVFHIPTAMWVPDSPEASGEIRIDVDYDGGTYTASKILTPPVSTQTYYALPSLAAKAWGVLWEKTVDLRPSSYDGSLVVKAAFGEQVTAEVTITYIGSPRVVDIVVFERPGVAVYVKSLVASSPAHYYTDGVGNKYAQYPSPYPIDAKDGTSDPTAGHLGALDTGRRQQSLLGPLLAQWCAWDETTGPTDTETVLSTTSSSFADLHDTNFSLTTYSESYAGWTTSSASYAQKVYRGGELDFRGLDGVVTVWVQVYASATAAGVVRVQTSISSWIDVQVTGSAGWYSGWGALRCGIGAEDITVLRLYAKTVGGGTLSLKALCIYQDTAGQLI